MGGHPAGARPFVPVLRSPTHGAQGGGAAPPGPLGALDSFPRTSQALYAPWFDTANGAIQVSFHQLGPLRTT